MSHTSPTKQPSPFSQSRELILPDTQYARTERAVPGPTTLILLSPDTAGKIGPREPPDFLLLHTI